MVLTEAIRYRSSHSHSGFDDWLILSYLWRQFTWWSIPIYGAFIFIVAFIRGFFGSGDDD